MKKKRIITYLLLACFCFANVMPVFAITERASVNKVYTHKVKPDKVASNDYKYEYVNLDFWKNFNDQNLNRYIVLAVENNYDLKIASLNVKEYYQNTKLQFASELPSATIGFSPAYYHMPGASNETAFSFPAVVNYEADIFLKNRDKTRSSKKLYEASKLDERAAYISIASAVGTTYFNIVKLNEIIDYQEKIVKSRYDIYNMMLESNKEGIVSTSDTVKANKSYVYGVSDLIELKKNKVKLLNQLAVLIGENPENIDKLAITPLKDINFTGIIPREMSTEVIINRPDYLKSEKMVEKAGIDVRIAKKEFLPSINLTGLALLNATSGGMFSSQNALWALAAGAMLPVFTGGSKIATLKLKKVQYDKVLESYYKNNLTAIQEVNDALASVKYDGDKLNENIKQHKLEKKDYLCTRDKYNQGVISKLDLIQTEENLLTVEKLVATSRSECFVSYIELYKAVGSKI